MAVVDSVRAFYKWSGPMREVYGLTAGLRIALKLRHAMWAGKAGDVVQVAVPGLPWPVFLRAGTSDAAVFEQVFIQGQGHFPVKGEPTFIIDAGANIGLVSACLAVRFPGATIVAMEIDEKNYSILRRNTERYPNIMTMRMGLWSHAATLAIENPGAESWAFRTVEVEAGRRGAIQAVGIEDVLRQYGRDYVDLMKIDVEGAEYELFSADVSKWIDRVGMLVIELHEQARPGVVDLVCETLAKRGFSHRRWEEYWIFSRSPNL